MAPRVSVVMPVFEAMPYLPRAVESVLDQTFTDFELIAADDGSSDDSWACLRQYAEADARVKLVQLRHGGIVSALNAALDAAQGEYIARMDADDISRPTRFAEQVAFLDANPEVAAVGTDLLRIDDRGMPLWTKGVVTGHADIERVMLDGRAGVMTHATTMFRRDVLRQAGGGYREEARHAEDLELFLRIAEHGRLANLDGVLYEVRMHLGSVTHRESVRMLYALKRGIIAEARRRRGLPAASGRMAVSDVEMGPLDHRLTWAWRSLGAMHFTTARRHALGVLRRRPWSARAWLVLAGSCLPGKGFLVLRGWRRGRIALAGGGVEASE